jgi:hypothetical protein
VTNAGDTRNFSRHVPRRLQAELLRDSLFLTTAGSKAESNARAELTGLAISGDMNPARRGRGDFALQIFGQSTRESNCDCDRSDQANLLQAIYLQNDIDIHQALKQNGGWVQEVTADWPKPRTGGAMTPERQAAMVAADERMQRGLTQRASQILKLPEARQAEARSKLKKELAQANAKREQFGYPPLNMSQLFKQAQGKNTGDGPSTDDSAAPSDQSALAKRPALDPAKIESAVQAAYLRTLCRKADNEELTAAIAFVQESEEPVSGFQSVVWALLNTKEFVLTH